MRNPKPPLISFAGPSALGGPPPIKIADFLADVSPEIPWHVTAFHPDYEMDGLSRTPASTLERAYEIGRSAGLKFVYAGNLPGGVGDRESTFCPGCSQRLVHRSGFRVHENRITNGTCPQCATTIPGIWV